MKPEVEKKLNNISNLPTLPAVMDRLTAAIDDPDSDARAVSKIIEDDPAIMTRVLKMVNSAFYASAYGRKIEEVLPAVNRLGFNTIKNIVFTTSLFSALPKSEKPMFSREDFWRHSISVGIVAEVLYEYLPNAMTHRYAKDVLHLAGIIHDIGKIIMEIHFAAPFHLAIGKAKEKGLPLYKAEQEIMGTDHAEIGAWLCRKWELPADIAEVVLNHHYPESVEDEKERLLVMLIHMADYICLVEKLGESGNSEPNYEDSVRKTLGLDLQSISEIMDIVEKESEKSEILLSLV